MNGIAAGTLVSTTSQKLVMAPSTSAFLIVAGAATLERRLLTIRRIERFAFGGARHDYEQVVELARHERHGASVVGSVAHDLPEPAQAASIEQLVDEIQRSIDDAPRDVAAEHRDEQLARPFATLVLDDDSGAERERQSHDEAEQYLAQARGGIEIAVQSEEGVAAVIVSLSS